MPTLLLFQDPAEIRLEPHIGFRDSPVGQTPVELDQWRVYLYCEALRSRNDDARLQVGYIGKQANANFCPITTFYEFSPPQREWMVAEAKKKHGKATPKAHVDIPQKPAAATPTHADTDIAARAAADVSTPEDFNRPTVVER